MPCHVPSRETVSLKSHVNVLKVEARSETCINVKNVRSSDGLWGRMSFVVSTAITLLLYVTVTFNNSSSSYCSFQLHVPLQWWSDSYSYCLNGILYLSNVKAKARKDQEGQWLWSTQRLWLWLWLNDSMIIMIDRQSVSDMIITIHSRSLSLWQSTINLINQLFPGPAGPGPAGFGYRRVSILDLNFNLNEFWMNGFAVWPYGSMVCD
jgi:hypothetical protein